MFRFLLLLSCLSVQQTLAQKLYDESEETAVEIDDEFNIIDVTSLDALKQELLALAGSKPLHLKISSKNITSLEVGLFEDVSAVEKLWLYDNAFTDVDEDAFVGLQNLKLLNLNKNGIETIIGSFSQLRQLEALKLAGNKITRLRRNYVKGMSKLKLVDLNENRISVWERGVFKGLHPELTVDLAHNFISNIPNEEFTNLTLKKLDLSDNQISSIPEGIFAGCNISVLILRQNKIQELTSQSFRDLTIVKLLDLSFNQLYSYDGVFNYLHQLTALQLNGNLIDYLAEDGFTGLDSLLYLHLYNNKITKIKDGSFNGLGNLQSLSLGSNHIQRVEERAFHSLSSLMFLEMDYNKVNKLHSETFQNSPALTMLNMDHNEFDAIPSIRGLRNASILRFNNNNIKTIPSRAFLGIGEKIQDIQLESNRIVEIEPNAFEGLEEIKHLRLSNNRIVSVEESAFAGVKSWGTIDLEGNRVSSIGVLEAMPSCKYIILSYNRIENESDLNLDDMNLKDIKFVSFESVSYKREQKWSLQPYPVSYFDYAF